MDFQLPSRFGLNKPTFKVMAGQHFAKFDTSLKPLKTLNTFVDLSKPMQDLNYIEHPKVRQIMQHLKNQNKRYEVKVVDPIVAISKQLEMELESLYKEDNETPLIDLVKLKFPPSLTHQLMHQSAVTLETHYNLHKLKEKMNNRFVTLTESELLNKINSVNLLQNENNDAQEFYRHSTTYRPRKQKQPEMSLEQKYKILRQYLKDRGIEMGRKEQVPNEGYLQFYHQATNKLMKQTKELQLLKFRKSVDQNQEQTPQKRISITKYSINPTTTMGTSINDVLLPFAKPGPCIIMSQRHKTERTPDKPYSEKWQDFVNRAQAMQTYYKNESKECQQTMEDLEQTLEKPYLLHFNQILQIEKEEGNLVDEQKQNKIIRQRKQNLPKKLRMQKIFKSELQ